MPLEGSGKGGWVVCGVGGCGGREGCAGDGVAFAIAVRRFVRPFALRFLLFSLCLKTGSRFEGEARSGEVRWGQVKCR